MPKDLAQQFSSGLEPPLDLLHYRLWQPQLADRLFEGLEASLAACLLPLESVTPRLQTALPGFLLARVVSSGRGHGILRRFVASPCTGLEGNHDPFFTWFQALALAIGVYAVCVAVLRKKRKCQHDPAGVEAEVPCKRHLFQWIRVPCFAHARRGNHMPQYEVLELDPALMLAYTKFWNILSCRTENVLAYHHLAYRELLMAVFGDRAQPRYWVVLDRISGEVVAALPCFVCTSDVGPTYCSLPFFGPNAGVICDHTHPHAPLWHEQLLSTALEAARASRAWSIALYTPLRFSAFEWYERALGEGFLLVEKFTQHMVLSEPPSWHSRRRRNIQHAKRVGLQVISPPTPEQIDAFWKLYEEDCSLYHIPCKPRVCLDAALQRMQAHDLAQLYVAIDTGNNDRVVAGLLTLQSRRTVSYYMPAYDPGYRPQQPIALLTAHAAREAVSTGRTLWNWEASPGRDSGIYRYKAHWGSQESCYRIYVKPLRSPAAFRNLGQAGILKHFPYFFVYPFSTLETENHA